MAFTDAARPTPTGTEGPRARRVLFSGSGILMAITFLTLLAVGATVSLATGSWWALAAAVVVHGLATIAFLVVFVPVLWRKETSAPSDPVTGEDDQRGATAT